MANETYARHGGVHFTQKASTEQINTFVRELSSDKRDSLFEVLDELSQAGLIQLHNDGKFADGNGVDHGTAGCYEDKEDR
jgi:hypothetical protein